MKDFVDYLEGERGRQSALARHLDVYPSAVCRWKSSPIPVEYVKRVSDFTGIPAKNIRPDIAAIFE